MDAFYASIEQRDNPDLKGKPVIVGGRPEERGVVAAASYEARKFGIRSAMPASRAMAACRDLVIVHPDFKKYTEVSRRLYNFYKEYTDLIEPLSLDEAYLDVTENKKQIPYATEIAIALKERIKKELGLTASAGVAPNKLLAKIASDEKKPDGLFVIKPHQVDPFMQKLDVKKIWGVGKVTLSKLNRMGVFTCGDLQRYSTEELSGLFGKFGHSLYSFCRGIDERPVITEREIKSVGAETTFRTDYLDVEKIKEAIFKQAERVSGRLKKNNLEGRTITIKIKYADFSQITRSVTLEYPICNAEKIYKAAEKLLEKTEAGERKIRLVGVSAGNLRQEKNIK
jgi:DNA polymerase IV